MPISQLFVHSKICPCRRLLSVLANVSLLAALLSGQVVQANSELPLLGDNAALNLEKEIELGKGLYEKLKESGYVIDDPLLTRYLADIGESLLASMNLRLRDYKFYLVKDASVNAFASPGGFIGVNVGLISMCRREDELAAVLAHEIAHVRLMHGMQLLEKSRDVNLAGMISILAAILVGAHDSELAGALVYGGMAGSTQSIVNFTRANEYEADRVGIGLLGQSDYDPVAMADFMQLLQSREGSGGVSSIEYLRTHPVNSNRIAEIQARIRDLDKKQGTFRRFDQFKDYLAYLYPQLFITRPTSDFYRALELTRNGQYQQGESLLRQLIAIDPDSIWYSYALADNLQFQSKLKQAESIYQSMLLLYPDDFAIGLRLAQIHIDRGLFSQARDLLLALQGANQEESRLYQLLAEVYRELGDSLPQKIAEADYHWYVGNHELARKLYKNLLEKEQLGPMEAERISKRISKS